MKFFRFPQNCDPAEISIRVGCNMIARLIDPSIHLQWSIVMVLIRLVLLLMQLRPSAGHKPRGTENR
jgi:hypothetical protein